MEDVEDQQRPLSLDTAIPGLGIVSDQWLREPNMCYEFRLQNIIILQFIYINFEFEFEFDELKKEVFVDYRTELNKLKSANNTYPMICEFGLYINLNMILLLSIITNVTTRHQNIVKTF